MLIYAFIRSPFYGIDHGPKRGCNPAARLLKEREGALGGTIRLLFQPAEEGGAGGEMMVSEGALEGVSAVHGIHVWPGLPSGTVASKVQLSGPEISRTLAISPVAQYI